MRITEPVPIFCLVVLVLERRDGLLDALGADVGRLLRDERLEQPVLEVLDLLGAGVEADDLHAVLLAGLAQAGGRALGAEQVGREDALEVRVLGQLRLDDRRGLVRLVLAVLDADVVEPELLGLLLEALGAQVGGRDARLGVDDEHRALAADRLGERLGRGLPPPTLSEAICETAKSAWSSVVSTRTTLIPARPTCLIGTYIALASVGAIRIASGFLAMTALTIGVCSVGVELVGPLEVEVRAELLGLGLGAAVHRDVELVALDAGDQRHLVVAAAAACRSPLPLSSSPQATMDMPRRRGRPRARRPAPPGVEMTLPFLLGLMMCLAGHRA